jgi:pyridoxine/pyridoxamine 5'-phosphate oxidase
LNHREKLERVLRLLEHGASDRHDAFHTAVLATIARNNEPEVRTIVFRRLLRDPLSLVCHVDRRSPKVLEIQTNPRVGWLFYHPAEKLQLRLRTNAFLHTDDSFADEQWENSELFSRRCYCGVAPSTMIDAPASGLPEFLEKRRPTAEETNELGRKNFAVIRSIVREMDVYELNADGHRRSLFIFHESGEIETRWLTP